MTIAIQPDAVRTTETPNAVMTTLASPTLNGTQHLSLWKVRMQPGSQGPVHAFDTEQVWHVIEGSASIDIKGTTHTLSVGDSLPIPAMAIRQVKTETGVEFIVCGNGDALVVSGSPGGSPITPAWIA
jgi:quercetin dioxygenase-like cupin family protein